VNHSTSTTILTTYHRRIESILSENKVAIKALKVTLAAAMVAFSLVAFGTVVIG